MGKSSSKESAGPFQSPEIACAFLEGLALGTRTQLEIVTKESISIFQEVTDRLEGVVGTNDLRAEVGKLQSLEEGYISIGKFRSIVNIFKARLTSVMEADS